MATATHYPFPPGPEPVPPRRHPHRHRWLRVIGWIFGGIGALIIVAVVVIAIAIHTSAFHHWVIRKAQTYAASYLGVPVNIENYALSLSPLRLDVYGVTIAGAQPHPRPPLLQLQHARVGVHIVSLLHLKWYLNDVELDHPVVQVYVDKNGHSNLPTLKKSSSKSNTSIFDLGIRHAVLTRGDVIYNSRPTPLTADLHNVEFQSAFNTAIRQYSGKLTYTDGRIEYGAYRPLVHNLDARFAVTPDTFHLSPLKISSSAAEVQLSAVAHNYSTQPSIQMSYNVVANGAEVARIMNDPSLPAGMVRASGTAHYQSVPNQPALKTTVLNGDLTSPQLLVKTSTLSAAITNLAAHYSLANGNVVLHDFHANVLGGEVTAQARMDNITGNSHSEATASIRRVSLSQARALMGKSASTGNVALTGQINADARAAWGKTIKDLVAKVNATITAEANNKQPSPAVPVTSNAPAPGAIPLTSAIHATYTGTNQVLTLAQSYVRLPETSLTLNGTISKRSSLAVRLDAHNLRELATVAGLFRTPAPGTSPQPLDLAGSATFNGNVQGSLSAPHITGHLSAANLHFNGSDWKVFRTDVSASPSSASLRNADLQPVTRGRITFSASTGLTKWKFTSTSPIQVQLDASRMNLADLTKLAGKQIPVTGTLNTQVSLHGTELNPVGNGKLALTNLTAYNQPVNSVDINFNGTGEEAHANLNVQTPAGTIQGNVSVRPKQKTYTAQLASSGIQLGQLETLKADNLNGKMSINVSGQGSFANPEAKATIQIPALTVQKQTLKQVNLELNMANHAAAMTLTSSAIGTAIDAQAHINLTGDYPLDATLNTKGIPLQPLLAVYAPAEADQVTGQTEIHATVRGPLKNMKALEAHVTMPYLNLGYGNTVHLATTAPIQADYKNRVLTVQRTAIQGTDTDLALQGSIPVGIKAPMSLMLQGTVNLKLMQMFAPDVHSSGQVKFNINSNGTGPNLGGQIDIVDANFASGTMPVGLQHGNGVLTLTSSRVDIKSFEGTVGGGKVTASGGVAYRPSLQFDLGMAAKGIRMLYPQGIRESVDANLRYTGTMADSNLGGTVNLTDLSLTPAFDLTSLMGQFSGVAAPPTLGVTQNVHFNLAVNSTNNVSLVSRTLSVNGSANLMIRGTAADPVILGRVVLNSGDVILNGERFILNTGTIQFINPTQTMPVVNVNLTTTVQQYNITMRFRGPADQLQTQYTSDPALPQADIIHLLAFGSTTEAAAQSTETTNQAAESLIASQVSSQFTSRISKVAGISQLSINPVLANGTSQGPPGAVLTIQQRVTGNLFITFSTNLASTQNEVFEGQYHLSPHVSISATRDPNGGFAVDTLIKKSF